MGRVLEICCFSVEDALVAQGVGADRIELCAGRPEGGTTPSLGVLERARSKIDIPAFPMVRPRGGDFAYGQEEFLAMRRDVTVIAELGFPGLVVGILNSDRSIDIARTTELIDAAKSVNSAIEVTFHRAFDEAADPVRAYRDVTRTGAKRLLTSGQAPTAIDGIELLSRLVSLQAGGPLLMPGSGVRPSNINLLLALGVSEVHSTATAGADAPMDRDVVRALADAVHAEPSM